MTQALRNVFEDLGLDQYIGSFQDHGFDTWETVQDITEADLETLEVKLGHRRKLQRQIAHFRGFPANAALPTSRPGNGQETSNGDSEHHSTSHEDGATSGAAVTKRRYRRHPKPDKNAPERPPSAYVLFSNRTREELKGQSLSFTEIAKIVGENWQRIPKETREKFETEAQHSKDKYRQELAEYKKTPEHEHYVQYLKDFKKKQQAAGKDSSRNPPLGTGRSHRASVSNGANSSIATGRNRPCQTVEPVSPVRHFGNIHAGAAGRPQEQHSESPEMSSSPGAISQGSMFDTRAIPIGGHPGPHRHQKLPSLSNILENRPDGGKLSMSSDGSVWGSRSVPGGSAVSHESMGPGGSPESSASGYALSASETDRPLPFSSLLSNAETQPVMYRAEPPRQSQPLLAYAGYR